MRIVKRNGSSQQLNTNKIIYRLRKLCKDRELGPLRNIDPDEIAINVCSSVYDGITSSEIDIISARLAYERYTQHEEFGQLAARIVISNMHKNTHECFSEVMDILNKNVDENGNRAPIISDEFLELVQKHKDVLDFLPDKNYSRDYLFDYFGFKVLEFSYLMRIFTEKVYNEKTEEYEMKYKIVERPQHMWIRVALQIHGDDLERVKETYELMSQKFFTHATPTLFNCGSPNSQMSSCYLIAMKDDSIEGIYSTLKDCAMISKYAGGIGLHVHNIRAAGSRIRGTNGRGDGIVPMLKNFNQTAVYVNQGSRRKGSFAIYIGPEHADIEDFLDLKLKHGDESRRARDLFYALWIPDLFMKQVKEDGDWYLMCPDESPGLADVHSEEFEKLYWSYVEQKRFRKKIRARDLYRKIIRTQAETGTPYILFKDPCNRKSNQQNLGTIKSSNLCSEVVQYSSPEEVAVCNLASIALSQFVDKKRFDFEKLHYVTKIVVRNLDLVIDKNFYPIPETRRSNMRHRPVGLGVQGLADVYVMLRHPFDSEEANDLNRKIFETMYHAALETSCELAQEKGRYETFEGSPTSKGILQFDMWNHDPTDKRYNWTELKEKIKEHGIRNSLLLACMPTASTSSILGNNEACEPFTSNLYSRTTLSGNYIIMNKHLFKELRKLDLWNEDMKDLILAHGGSIQNIPAIPKKVKELFKTAWEISPRAIIDQAAARGPFICQSQSMNLFVKNPEVDLVGSVLKYTHEKGLKTGVYYLHSRPATNAIQFTINKDKIQKKMDELQQLEKNGFLSVEPEQQEEEEGGVCRMEEDCLVCSS